MNRREALAHLGAGVLAGVGGCLSGPEPGGNGVTPTDEDPSGTATPTPGSTTGTATPIGQPADESTVLPRRRGIDRVVWYEDVEDTSEGLFLEPETTETVLPSGDLSIHLRNRTERRFVTNYYGWALYRRENDRWYYVAPLSVPQPAMTLYGGRSHTWTLSVDNGDLSAPSLSIQGTDDLDLHGLGEGEYAFAVDGWWEDQDATPTHEHETLAVCRFSIGGEPLTVEPSGAVESVERDGSRVVVSAARDGYEDQTAATYFLERAAADDPTSLVTESVYRRWPLRDAVAHLEADVDTVAVQARTGASPLFGIGVDSPTALEYEGETYRIRAEEGWA